MSERSLPFTKMSAGGNDFIVFDEMGKGTGARPPLQSDFIRRVCARALSVGADGVILMAPAEEAPGAHGGHGAHGAQVRMSYWNADGGRASLCGNGVRCVARLAILRGHVPASGLTIQTDAGLLPAGMTDSTAWFRIALGAPAIRRMRLRLPETAGVHEPLEGILVGVGVPHLVVEVPDAHEMTGERLAALAPLLRRHPDLGAEGANVDFATVRSRREAAIRCWERGVEGETLSSGTGCIATAIALAHAGRCDDEIALVSRTGLVSTVRLERDAAGALAAVLSGDARVIYTGQLTEEATRGFTP